MEENKKLPSILCDEKLWKEYIEPFLIKWGYSMDYVSKDWEKYSLLVLNYQDSIGICANIEYFPDKNYLEKHNRCIEDLDKFLDKAAELKGFIYGKSKNYVKGIKIFPGMVIKTDNGTYITIPTEKGFAYVRYDKPFSWTYELPSEIIEIHDIPDGETITGGKLLWEISGEKFKVTKKQIAEKFNIPIDKLIIE